MSKPAAPDEQGTSTRPYLIRALHTWCADNGFTPYLAVYVSPQVQVPLEYVKNNEIVLNVGFEATSGLKLGNELIEFRARFGGTPRDILVPVDHVVAIYARENGQGMAFPTPALAHGGAAVDATTPAKPGAGTDAARSGLRLATAGEDASADPGADVLAQTLAPVSAPVHLAPAPDAQEPGPGGPGPRKPPGPAGGRPSLKRVK